MPSAVDLRCPRCDKPMGWQHTNCPSCGYEVGPRRPAKGKWIFSLRSLLVATAVVAALLAMIGPPRRVENVDLTVKSWTNSVRKEWRIGGTRLDARWKSGDEGLDRLVSLGQVVDCKFFGGLTDAGLAEVGKWRKLESLTLFRCPISGAGLGQLSDSPRLGYLSLTEPTMDDATLASIGKLQSLRYLNLYAWHVKIAPGELRELTDLPIETLSLGYTDLDDGGIDALCQMRQLTSLDISGTRVTDRGLAELKRRCPKLIVLSLVCRTEPSD